MNARLHPASGWAPPSPMPAKRTAADGGVHSALSSSSAVVADLQTLPDADDIISEFLGQINADFSTSTAETVRTTEHRSVQTPGSCQFSVGSVPSSLSSQQSTTAAAAAAGTDDRLFPLPYDRSTANRSASMYGFPGYQRNHKEPEAVDASGLQRPVGAPFKPTTGSYTGYGALPSYDLTISDGHDLATGPAAETLKKMAAMHRSLYEKSASPPPSDMGWLPGGNAPIDERTMHPYHQFPVSGYNCQPAPYADYARLPPYRQHHHHPQQQQQQQQQQLPPPYSTGGASGGGVATSSYGRCSSLSVASDPTCGVRPTAVASYNGTGFGGAMKPLSHYPVDAAAAATKTSASARSVGGGAPARPLHQPPQHSPNGFIRMSQTQHVNIQQHPAGGETVMRQNGSVCHADPGFQIEASQTQHVHVRVNVGHGPQGAALPTGAQPSCHGAGTMPTRSGAESAVGPMGEMPTSWRPTMSRDVQGQYEHCMTHVQQQPPNTSKDAADVRWFRHASPYGPPASGANAADDDETCRRGAMPNYVALPGGPAADANCFERLEDTSNCGYRNELRPTLATTVTPSYRQSLDQKSATTVATVRRQTEQVLANGSRNSRPGGGQFVFQADQKQSVSVVIGGGGGIQMASHPVPPTDYAAPSSKYSLSAGGVEKFEQHYIHHHQQQQQLRSWNSTPAQPSSNTHLPVVDGGVSRSVESDVRSASQLQTTYDVMDFSSCDENGVIDMAPVEASEFLPVSCYGGATNVNAVSAASSTSLIAVGNSNDLSFIDEILGNR
jgi:hypothetical protein